MSSCGICSNSFIRLIVDPKCPVVTSVEIRRGVNVSDEVDICGFMPPRMEAIVPILLARAFQTKRIKGGYEFLDYIAL